MPSQSQLLWFILVCALVYIIWMDVRPTVRQWLAERRSHPLGVSQDVLVWAYNVRPDVADAYNYSPVVRLRHFVQVSNTSRGSLTMRSVKGYLRFHARNLTLQVKDHGDFSIDIHPGESAFFYVGEVFTDKILESTAHHEVESVDKHLYDSWMSSVEASYRKFDFDNTTNLLAETVPNNGPGIAYELIFVGDNLPPRRALLFVRPYGDPTAWVEEVPEGQATAHEVGEFVAPLDT